jgi:hypothetical protein
MEYTFFELIEKNKIKIPLIQRDYAQGRTNELELRNSFITKLKEVLDEDGAILNLDFIYGYTHNIHNDDVLFIPLDGQQRLTTLWLLHWYFAAKKGIDVSEKLKRFSYETRVSAKRFSEALITHPIKSIEEAELMSEVIKDASWFMASWKNDPTIISILNMLDTIHSIMNDCKEGWKSLVIDKKITFEYIDIKSEEFKLTDELYIKMNSRGKPLTDFENFKAQFSNLLSTKNTDFKNETLEFEGTNLSYQQYFAFKIDGVWMDLFWKHKNRSKETLDKQILNYINYVSEFLYFKNCVTEEGLPFESKFNFIKQIYLKKENVDFLFNSFNFFSKINNLDNFFDKIFTLKEDEILKVNLFDGANLNLFERAIANDTFDARIKVLLYAIIEYSIENLIEVCEEKLIDFIRIIRNLVFNVKQINQTKRIEYTTNLRIQNSSDYSKFIDEFVALINENPKKNIYKILVDNKISGFPRPLIKSEIRKARCFIKEDKLKSVFFQLENNKICLGYIDNFHLESSDIVLKIRAFNQIWNSDIKTSLIIRAFLAAGNYSVQTHYYSALGRINFFGSKNYWNRIIATNDKDEIENVSNILNRFLSSCMHLKNETMEERLENSTNLIYGEVKPWQHYFLNYPEMTYNNLGKLNLYTWKDENGFDINQLGNAGNQPLLSYHVNPYLAVINSHFTHSNKVHLDQGRYSDDWSSIKIKNDVLIFGTSYGFQITIENDYKIPIDTINDYKIEDKETYLELKEFDDRDRIELAIDFIKDLIK